MRNQYLVLILGIITFVTFKPLPIVAAISGVGFCYFYFLAFREMRKGVEKGHQEMLATDKQLREELTATHQLVLWKLSGAEEEIKLKVIELLVEAGKHLGNPVTNSRIVYGSDFYIKWNREGLDLVAQARQLTEEYAARAEAHEPS